MQKTSIWGVVWWEDFHEEESEGLLPVLHLGSDWPSSPKTAPYKRHACLHCLRHPSWGPKTNPDEWPRQGERLSEERASQLAAHHLSRLAGRADHWLPETWAVEAVRRYRLGFPGGLSGSGCGIA